MMTIWLMAAAFTGMMLTLAYATLVYAFFLSRAAVAGLVGILAAATTLTGISSLIIFSAAQLDAGGLFVHFLFIAVASLLGGPVGLAVFGSALRRIGRRQ